MYSRILRLIPLFALSLIVFVRQAQAQIIIIDRRPEIPIARSYEIREVAVDGTIRDQVAEIQVTHTIHNPGSFTLEAEYFFPLPEEGAIQNLTLMVDGKELPGRIIGKDEARKIYEEIVRRKKDPALMEYIGSGLFRTRVFPIPAGADRKVSVRYTQLCRLDRHVVNFTYLMDTQKLCARPIGKFKMNLRITSQSPIKTVYSPTHEPKIERQSDHEASVRLEQEKVSPTGDFHLLYTVGDSPIGVTVLSYKPENSSDGYFLLLASPQIRKVETKPQPKTVIFVLDRSGSMAGAKLEQARGALRFVLDNLKEGDLFNIVVYDDRVESFKPDLQNYCEVTRQEAMQYIDGIESGGSTDINQALDQTLKMIKDSSRPGYVLFLTDGLPTSGEMGEMAIAKHCREANKSGARLFAFGVGYDVNTRLLDRLSGGNGGVSEYVRPTENIESHVSTFYSRLTSPVLSAIQVNFPGIPPSQLYPANIPDLFEGGQLVLVGRYHKPGEVKLHLAGKVSGKPAGYDYTVQLADVGQGFAYNFVERVWAIRRIGYLIDQIDLNGENKELIDELTRLSTRYGILTPYTSFLADEDVHLDAYAANSVQAAENLTKLNAVSGAGAQAQRVYKNRMMNAPMAASADDAKSLLIVGEALSAAGGSTKSFGGGRTEAKPSSASRIRQLGNKTFYFKEGRWIDSGVNPEQEKMAVVIRQFSAEYFKLSGSLKSETNQYLTFKEPVVVELDGKVYRINPASH